jgi:alpha-L-arabinofuranosidase
MFKGHQGGQSLECVYTSPQREIERPETVLTNDKSLEVITASASLSSDGKEMLITLTNADLEKSYTYSIEVVGSFVPASGHSYVLAADPRAQNTFEDPEHVRKRMHSVTICDGTISVQLQPCSVVSVGLTKAEK